MGAPRSNRPRGDRAQGAPRGSPAARAPDFFVPSPGLGARAAGREQNRALGSGLRLPRASRGFKTGSIVRDPRALPVPGSLSSAAASGPRGTRGPSLSHPMRAGPARPSERGPGFQGRGSPRRALLHPDSLQTQASSGSEAVLRRPPTQAGRTAGRDLNAAPALETPGEPPNPARSGHCGRCARVEGGWAHSPPPPPPQSHLPRRLLLSAGEMRAELWGPFKLIKSAPFTPTLS